MGDNYRPWRGDENWPVMIALANTLLHNLRWQLLVDIFLGGFACHISYEESRCGRKEVGFHKL